MDTKKPDDPKPDPKAADTDLEAVFARWEQARDALPPGAVVDDLPLSDEELALDHEVAKRPEAMLEKARTAAQMRLGLAVILSIVCVSTLWLNREDFAFYLIDESEIVDMGDLRARWKAGERPGDGTFPALTHNTWMRFESGIMVEEREGASGTFYFFDPILKAIVVTARALPEKSPRSPVLHASFAELVNERWILVSDLTAAFSGQGRLVRASEAPRRYRNIITAYRGYLQLDARMDPADLWLFLDGAEPTGQLTYVAIYVVAFVVMLLGFLFYWSARRRLRVLEETVALSESSSPA